MQKHSDLALTAIADCNKCPRLTDFLHELKLKYPDYHNAPVLPFGAKKPKLLIVGLAPGMHGANASGRPFTGDYAGILLYETLYKFGFANRAQSTHLKDGLELVNCQITNAVKCLPPQNKPLGVEINTCNQYLSAEIKSLYQNSIILALGSIAHNAVLKALELKLNTHKFGHNLKHELPGDLHLVDSYHCSRYNTQTKRLTVESFEQVFIQIRNILKNAKNRI